MPNTRVRVLLVRKKTKHPPFGGHSGSGRWLLSGVFPHAPCDPSGYRQNHNVLCRKQHGPDLFGEDQPDASPTGHDEVRILQNEILEHCSTPVRTGGIPYPNRGLGVSTQSPDAVNSPLHVHPIRPNIPAG